MSTIWKVNLCEKMLKQNTEKSSCALCGVYYRKRREYFANNLQVTQKERYGTLQRSCANVRNKSVLFRVQEVYTGAATCVMNIIPISIEETWSMFRKSYPSLRDLPMHEQVFYHYFCNFRQCKSAQMELYRFYLPNFTMVDSYLRAWKVWGTYHE